MHLIKCKMVHHNMLLQCKNNNFITIKFRIKCQDINVTNFFKITQKWQCKTELHMTQSEDFLSDNMRKREREKAIYFTNNIHMIFAMLLDAFILKNLIIIHSFRSFFPHHVTPKVQCCQSIIGLGTDSPHSRM